jgi:hypothetical protein
MSALVNVRRPTPAPPAGANALEGAPGWQAIVSECERVPVARAAPASHGGSPISRCAVRSSRCWAACR